MKKKYITAGLALAALLSLVLPLLPVGSFPGAAVLLEEAGSLSLIWKLLVCFFLLLSAAAVPAALFGDGKIMMVLSAVLCGAVLIFGSFLIVYIGDLRMPAFGTFVFASLEAAACLTGVISAVSYEDKKSAAVKAGRVVIEFGIMQGAELFPADQETLTIGRSVSQCNLVLDGRGISRMHCSITYLAGNNSYVVRDLSRNGTWMSNGRQLPPQAAVELMAGSVIYLAVPQQRIRLG